MNIKKIVLPVVIVALSLSAMAQKPKKTHDYKKFAKKAVMSMMYIEKMYADDAALSFISDKSGVSVDDLKAQKAANITTVKEDVKFITDNSIYGVMGTIELTNVRKTPVMMADIVVNYTNKTGSFQFILTNCTQTNISWYMGDRIDAQGEGIAGLIALRAEKKEKAENGLLGKIAEAGEKEKERKAAAARQQARTDSLNALRKGHLAKTFPMVGTDRSSKYFKHDQVNMPLNGYYVTTGGQVIEAVIAYQKPEFLVGKFAASASLFVCKEANGKKVDVLNVDSEPNFKGFIKKDQLWAFYVGDQLFANIKDVGWRIVTSEGAIHTFVNMAKMTKNGNSTYATFEQAQKMDGQVMGSVIAGPSTKAYLEFMEDCPEIAQALKNEQISLHEAIVKYNIWYDLQHPGQVMYIPGPEK